LLSLNRSRLVCVASSATHDRAKSSRGTRTYERVLRYPDGHVRRIVYPVVEEVDEVSMDEPAPCPSFGFWHDARPLQEPRVELPSTSYSPAPTEEKTAEDLFHFDWDALRKQAENLAARVKGTYEVMMGCPWVAPKPMWALTIGQANGNSTFYTLRTRIETGQEVQDELAKVLGSKSLAKSLNLSQMEDGVVAFLCREDAEAFADALHGERAGRGEEVCIVDMSSHELFRFVRDSSAVLVAVRGEAGSGWLPEPHQLAGALRGQAAWDDMV